MSYFSCIIGSGHKPLIIMAVLALDKLKSPAR